MTLWTSDPSKTKYAREYFSSINPMAARIVEVQSNLIKSIPTEKWMNMSAEEQEKALNQCVITPEAANRYRSIKPTSHLPKYYQSVFPKVVVESGQVYAAQLDDSKEKETWKDEHSHPFSWETRSQMNMPLPSSSKDKSKAKKKPIEKTGAVHEKKGVQTRQNGKAHQPSVDTSKFSSVDSSKLSSVDISEKPLGKSSATNNKNGADLAVESVEISLFQSQTNRLKNVPVEDPSTNHVIKRDGLSNGAKQHKKTKSSSRINPRKSVTLDDDEPLLSEDDSGAIRNLEVAMKEAQVHVVDPEISTAPPISVTSPPETTTKMPKFEQREESPLLDSSPSISINLEETTESTSRQKSGFDFLDNW